MTSTRPRRQNAPVNPHRRRPTAVSDLLLALGAVAWAMGAAFFVASFGDNNVTDNETGRQLARLFAGSLFVAGTFTFLLGVGLLRGERGRLTRYVAPVAIGTVTGTLDAVLFLSAAGVLLIAPFGLLVLAPDSVRRMIWRLFQRGRAR